MNYLQAGFTFAATFILAKNLGTEEFGLYTFGLVLAGIVGIVGQVGSDKSLIRDLVQLEDPACVLLSASVVKAAVSFILILIIQGWLIISGEDGYLATLTFLIYGAGMSLSPRAWYDFRRKLNFHSMMVLAEKAIFFACVIIVVFFHFANKYSVMILCLTSSRLLCLVAEWRFIARELDLPTVFSRVNIRGFVSGNQWIWFAGLGNLMMTHVNQIILKGKTDERELAYFGFAFQLIAIVRLLQTQILRLTAPAIAVITSSTSVARDHLQTMSRQIVLSMALTTCAIVPLKFAGPWIARFVNDDFAQSVSTLDILLLWSLVFGAALIVNQYLLSYRLQYIYFRITTIFGLFSIALAWVLIPIYQADGAALALLISHSLSILFQLVYVVRHVKKNF